MIQALCQQIVNVKKEILNIILKMKHVKNVITLAKHVKEKKLQNISKNNMFILDKLMFNFQIIIKQ